MIIDIGLNRKLLLAAANPGLRSMYDENDGNTAVYFLKDAKAAIEFCRLGYKFEKVSLS